MGRSETALRRDCLRIFYAPVDNTAGTGAAVGRRTYSWGVVNGGDASNKHRGSQ